MSGAGSALSAAPSSGARGWVLGGIAAAAACAWWASASRRARCDDAAVAARDAQMAKGFSVCSGAAFQANNPGWMKVRSETSAYNGSGASARVCRLPDTMTAAHCPRRMRAAGCHHPDAPPAHPRVGARRRPRGAPRARGPAPAVAG